jgi:hypothetical protein
MRLTVLTLTLAVVVSACSEDPVQPTTVRVPAVQTALQAATANRSIVEFNGQVRKDFRQTVASLGGTVDFVADGAGFAGVSGLAPGALATLQRSNGVSAVYDDIVVQLDPVQRGDALSADMSAMSPTNPAGALAFNAFQWNMRAISAPAAWAAGNLGSPNVTAAILDTGLDYDNFDLNGLVDLSRSVSFVPSDDAILTALFPTRNKLDDLGGHGTLVASQVSSNALVFAGVSSRTRLMGIKVLGFSGSGQHEPRHLRRRRQGGQRPVRRHREPRAQLHESRGDGRGGRGRQRLDQHRRRRSDFLRFLRGTARDLRLRHRAYLRFAVRRAVGQRRCARALQ